MKNNNYHSQYIIQQDDTLESIAKAHNNINLEELLSIPGNNKFTINPNLHRGEKITVPTIYITQKGDTLIHIAATHNMN